MQCNAALKITGAIRGNSREKLYQELDIFFLFFFFNLLYIDSLTVNSCNDIRLVLSWNMIPPVKTTIKNPSLTIAKKIKLIMESS